MNKLSIEKRSMILNILCEGMSIRSVSRTLGVSINTVSKLLVDAGTFCSQFHDTRVRNVEAARIQADEIWSFTYAKQKKASAKSAPDDAEDTWTWTAIDADSKLIVSWLVGGRSNEYAEAFMLDLRDRLTGRIQLTTDGDSAYPSAVEMSFGADVDYTQLVKVYRDISTQKSQRRYSPGNFVTATPNAVTGDPDPKQIGTSAAERLNLSLRMDMRRFNRLTNAFSKKFENHVHMVAIYTVFYNWIRIHKSLKVTPAMEAGLTERTSEWADILDAMDAAAPARKAGPY